MFAIQYLDHEEGSAARWRNVCLNRFAVREDARDKVRKMRAADDEYCLYSYRIAEVGSPLYNSQPTDALEY